MQSAQHASVVQGLSHLSRQHADGQRPIDPSVANLSGNHWLLFLLAAVLAVAGAASFNVDCSVAIWFHQKHGLNFLHSLTRISELFGRGECVLLVAVLIWQLDRSRRWAVPAVVATALLSGLGADLVKMVIARARPHSFDLLAGVWASFGPVLPLGSMGSAGESFPSGHTATAVGLAIALMTLYPAARQVFCILPLLVAYQRVDSGAHFLSDVLCGAAVGCLVGGLILRSRWLEPFYAQRFWGRAQLFVARFRQR